MEVYRLADARFADLSGLGGVYGAARWHHKGQPILYTGQSRSICVLERFVHEDPVDMPKLKMLTIHIPDSISIERVTDKQLPKGWDSLPESTVSRDFGSEWLQEGRTAVLQLPSAIVRDEYNFLVNPLHSEAQELQLLATTDFYYDARLGAMIR